MRKLLAKALAWASNKIDAPSALQLPAAPVDEKGEPLPLTFRGAEYGSSVALDSFPEPEGVAGAIVRARNLSGYDLAWAKWQSAFCEVAWTHQSRAAVGDHQHKATHRAQLVLPPPPPGAPPRPPQSTYIICDACTEHAKRNGGWALTALPSVSKSTDLGTLIEGASHGPQDVENTQYPGAD